MLSSPCGCCANSSGATCPLPDFQLTVSQLEKRERNVAALQMISDALSSSFMCSMAENEVLRKPWLVAFVLA